MRVYTESCIQLRLIDVKISQLAIKVSAREWIGVEGLCFRDGGRDRQIRIYLSVLSRLN